MRCQGVTGAVMAVAILVATPALVHAQQQQYGQPPNTYTTWSPTPQQPIDVTYFIDPALGAPRTTLIQQAAAAWNSAGSGVRLVAGGAGSNIQWTALGGVLPYSFSFAAPPTLQPGTYPNGSPWATINGPATVGINTAYPFWDGTGVAPSPLAIDFQFLSLDLFGRALGLGFASGEPGSVMQPDANINFATAGPHSLSSNDIVSMQAVYGSPEPSTLALLGIGLSLIGASKKFRRFASGR